MRLIDLLKSRDLSNREARGLLLTGKVSVGGMPTADGARQVREADVVVDLNAPRLQPGRDLIILRRDAHVAVVFKPPGMLAVPAPRREDTPNVVGMVRNICGSAYAVHRLDEPTSGLMMVALTPQAQHGIKAQLEAHDIERGYLAIVQRAMRSEPFEVRNTLVRDRGDGKRGSGDAPDARPAATMFHLVESLPNASIVSATLETGRTHQVRIHLSELRHPVLGDALYGGRGVARLAPRLALHACRLGFVHPVTGERWRFDIPLADDLEILRRQLLEPRPQKARKPKPKGPKKPKKKAKKRK